ncbi:hypothetical protein GNI_049790 [Gregarina niphandrodes]|uniref:NELF-A N-terminal domain-containing protein n=1 Tax=Gregarina niphandrodes TaxID=110365 RepID=A0A023B9K5_GRENI|nr:hypothetical protein GNI_049790 [Gregarina niphandrodes]EZG73002.1 hypothetical protein GNI_049790 [Gregarina niphandrodes]|eukprot:XP_011129697.1 hypothetical protein GNI_049790 [Gregarina niphandrodes]
MYWTGRAAWDRGCEFFCVNAMKVIAQTGAKTKAGQELGRVEDLTVEGHVRQEDGGREDSTGRQVVGRQDDGARQGNRELAAKYVEYLQLLSHQWSSVRAASLLTPELIEYLQPRYHRCSSPLKVRIVSSLVYLSSEIRVQAKDSLIKLLAEAEVDKDEWVRKLGRLMSSFVTTGSIDVRDTDSETAFQILKHVNSSNVKHKPPLDISDMVNIVHEYMFVEYIFAEEQRTRVCGDEQIREDSGTLPGRLPGSRGGKGGHLTDPTAMSGGYRPSGSLYGGPHSRPPTPENQTAASGGNGLYGIRGGPLPASLFGTTDFRPGLDLQRMYQDLCKKGDVRLEACRTPWP